MTLSEYENAPTAKRKGIPRHWLLSKLAERHGMLIWYRASTYEVKPNGCLQWQRLPAPEFGLSFDSESYYDQAEYLRAQDKSYRFLRRRGLDRSQALHLVHGQAVGADLLEAVLAPPNSPAEKAAAMAGGLASVIPMRDESRGLYYKWDTRYRKWVPVVGPSGR